MSESHPFVRVVKAELRSRGMTYAQLARELGLAESTVKRMMARGELSLTRLDAILAVLKLDATDLARQVVESAPVARELSPEQEAAVVADARVLLVAICALGQWPAQRILSHFTLSQAELTGCLTRLDRIGFLELRPNDRYRLRVDRAFRWRANGPVMRFFRHEAAADYFAADFGGAGEMLMMVHAQVTPAQAAVLNDRLQRVAQDFVRQQQVEDAPGESAQVDYTMLLGMRSWIFGPFRQWLRPPSPRQGTG
jgi:transcriptional regulator with XRE-family HTH domain